jgi:RHS repeat-associated protein
MKQRLHGSGVVILGLTLIIAVFLSPLTAREKRPFLARQQVAASTSIVGQTETLLPDGNWLLIGGESTNGMIATPSIKNSTTGAIQTLKYKLLEPRAWHTATLLPDGTVFIFGGVGNNGRIVNQAEVFDPTTQTFSPVNNTGLTLRSHHTATLLTDGHVLLAGGLSDGNETLESAESYDPQSHTGGSTASLLFARHDQTAGLLPDGEVLLWGGVDSHREAIHFGEIFDPATLRFRIETTQHLVSTGGPYLEISIPSDGSANVAVNTLISLRFSKPLLVTTVNSNSVSLIDPSGNSGLAKVIPAEGGMLGFVTPSSPLLPSTQYTLTASGLTDPSGEVMPSTSISFITAGNPENGSIPFGPDTGNSDGTGGINSRWKNLPPLEAPSGVTALAGQSLRLNGFPLEDLTLVVEEQNVTARTDDTGRFLLKGLSAGHHVLYVNGGTASRRGQVYGTYEIGVDISAGKTNVLPYTIWMTELDTADAVVIPSPTIKDLVITTPKLPGLELHIPAGTIIKDHEGQIVTQISITPVPLNQPPFPLPQVPVPIYFTIQPGAAYFESRYSSSTSGSSSSGVGAQLYYPNAHNAAAGTTFDFWNYDPDQKGWYVYGHGTVGPDKKQIIPDAGVKIYEFTGAMVGSTSLRPPVVPPAVCNSKNPGGGPPCLPPPPTIGADPVDFSTGLFVYDKTDLVLEDVLPVSLTRTYRQADSVSRAFGIGTTHPFDIFLVGNTSAYSYAELVLPDGSVIRYNRTSSGTGYSTAVFIHTDTTSMFYGSVMAWNGAGWTITLRNGTVYVFPDGFSASRPQQAALISIKDRHNNIIVFNRDGSGNLNRITTPNGRWINFTYDSNYRVTQAADNLGRTVSYTYDSSGRLSTVTDAKGGVTTYTYDTSNNMLTITDPRSITYLTNQYDSNNRVTKQTFADGSTYQIAYTLTSNTSQSHFVTLGSGYTGAGPGKDISGFRSCSGCTEGYAPLISSTDVTDQRGHVRHIVFGNTGYIASDTLAYGETGAQTTTYQYYPDNLLETATDALSRTTAYVYDANDNTTQVTQLSGTSNAASTSFTYESTYNQIASVTDPLSHTTSYSYDSSVNLSGITDPLGHQTAFTVNGQGQITSTTDPIGNAVHFYYTNDDLVATTDSLDRTVSMARDASGRLVSTTDPAGQTTQYAYDNLNEKTSVTDPADHVTAFAYDGNGNLLTVTDTNSHATTYAYDNMDRVSTRTDALSNAESYSYDAAGNLSTFTDRRGKVTSYTYDSLNRRTFAGFGTTSGPTYESTITYSYDAGNRLSSVVDSVAGTITPTFDGLNRLTEEQSTQGTVSYAYDATGRRTSMTVGGQTAVDYTYDNANRLTQITQGTPTVSFSYDNANRRTSLTLPNGVEMSYGYNSGSQLTGITFTLGSSALGNLTYNYDVAGRRTSLGGTLAQSAIPLPVSTTSYNANNQLTEWGTASLYYDANGNMTSDGTNSYVWNARNQLASMDSSAYSFQYDGYGRRTGKTISGTTTNYLYDGGNTVQELSGSTVTANLLTGLGVDERFARTDSSGTANFLTDALGSTLALTNSSGGSLAQYAYEPFGNTTVTSGSSTNSYEYTGRESDGTGLQFNRARYYSPTLQRFISEDPAFPAGGINGYAYASNNPIFWADPFGLNPTPVTPWDRLKLVGQGIGSLGVGLGKLGVGTGAAAAAPETGGLSLALTYYSWYSSLGNFGAAGADFYGAISGNVAGAEHAANVSSAASSISGLATWVGTGNVNAGATASNIEGIGLFGLSGGLGVPIHLSDVYDLVDSGSGVVAPATH